jgi:hypothetical protein
LARDREVGVRDPLAPLLELAGVEAALDDARAAADAAFGSRLLRRFGGRVAAEVGLRSAVASAALEGSAYDREHVRAGTVTDPVVQGALRVSLALDRLAPLWTTAPPQVLARLHTLAARDLVTEPGRPATARPRLGQLIELVRGGSKAPALLQAAIVHGELLALGVFAGANGVVARAAERLTLISAGLDPRGLLPVEVGHLARRDEYVGSARAYTTGTNDGLRAWIRHCARAVEVAASDLVAVCDEMSQTQR